MCGAEVEKSEEETIVRCINPLCPEQQQEKIEHFVSRSGMNIRGVGPKLVEQLLAEELIHDAGDLYRLTHEQLIELTGIREKSAQKIMQAIERSKRPTLAQLLYALGIRYVGKQTAQLLAEHFGSLEGLKIASKADLMNIQGIGLKAANSITRYFHDEQTARLFIKMFENGVEIAAPDAASLSQHLTDKRFVLTGTLEAYTRDEVTQLIEQAGGRVTSSMSANTDYLVIGRKPSSSKITKAQKLGIEILDEAAFQKLLIGG